MFAEEAERFKVGWGGYPLIGTPERIVDSVQTLSDIGLDGISLMPLLEQAGLRKPFKEWAAAAD